MNPAANIIIAKPQKYNAKLYVFIDIFPRVLSNKYAIKTLTKIIEIRKERA